MRKCLGALDLLQAVKGAWQELKHICSADLAIVKSVFNTGVCKADCLKTECGGRLPEEKSISGKRAASPEELRTLHITGCVLMCQHIEAG